MCQNPRKDSGWNGPLDLLLKVPLVYFSVLIPYGIFTVFLFIECKCVQLKFQLSSFYIICDSDSASVDLKN